MKKLLATLNTVRCPSCRRKGQGVAKYDDGTHVCFYGCGATFRRTYADYGAGVKDRP